MRESDKQFSLCTVHSEEFLTHRRCALHSSGPILNGVESSCSAFLVCSAPRPAVGEASRIFHSRRAGSS